MIYQSKFKDNPCYQGEGKRVTSIRIFPDMEMYVKVGEGPIYIHYELKPELRTAQSGDKKQLILHR